MKRWIRARADRAESAQGGRRGSRRVRGLAAAAAVLATAIAGTLAARGLTASAAPAPARAVARAAADPVLTITKTADRASFSGAGQVIVYTYVIRNDSAIPVVSLTVDDSGLGVVCRPAVLSAGTSRTCTASYRTSSADVARGVVYNRARVEGIESAPRTPVSSVSALVLVRFAPSAAVTG